MRRLLALLFVLCTLPLCALAEVTVYRGETTLWSDTLWEGEVLVDGILTVAPGATLEIRPGTIVRFTFFDSNNDGIGEHELFLQGVLRARGRADAPILFTSAAASPHPGAWGAINLMASEEESQLDFCIVEFAYRGFHGHFAKAVLADDEFRRNVRGVQFQESEVQLLRSRVVDNLNAIQFRDSQVVLDRLQVSGNYWGIRGVHSRVQVSRCRVEENLVNGINLRDCDAQVSASHLAGNRKGLYLQESRGSVRDSLFAGNSEHGIFLEESDVAITGNRLVANGRAGVKWVASAGILQANRFEGGGEYDLVNDSALAVDARGNWWGSVDAGRIAAAIRDGADLTGIGPVDASGFLSAPPAFDLNLLP